MKVRRRSICVRSRLDSTGCKGEFVEHPAVASGDAETRACDGTRGLTCIKCNGTFM
jgi:hypothetical protein